MSFLKTSLCIVAALICGLAQSAHAVRLNAPAPDFSLKDLQGVSRSLSAARGQVVLINFWSTGCPPCVSELPSLNQLHSELGGSGLLVLGVALDPSAKPVRELVSRLKLGFPILMDSNKDVYFDSYGLFGQPVSVIVDRKGVVREKLIGAADWTAPQIRQKISAYLKER